jgi:hypothetical protein
MGIHFSSIDDRLMEVAKDSVVTVGSATVDYVVELSSRIAGVMVNASISQTEENLDQINYTHLSKRVAEFISRQGPEFVKNINMTAISEIFGEEFSKAVIESIRNLDLKKIALALGPELRAAILAMDSNITDALSRVAGHLTRGMVFNTVPYMAAGIAALFGTALAITYLYRRMVYNIGRPPLAQKVKRHGYFSWTSRLVPWKLLNRLWGSTTPKIVPVFDSETTRRITHIKRALTNTSKHNGFQKNIIFYGPGGTGKTLISEDIAEASGLDYIMMSGGDLAQFIKRGEHVTVLKQLLHSIQKPTILFIDEFEGAAKRRDTIGLSEEHLELINCLLHETGTPSKTLSLFAATNRLEDIDSAMLTRFDYKIFIGPPGPEQRRGILAQNIASCFKTDEILQFFQSERLDEIVLKTNGFTGRMLQKLVHEIQSRKNETDSSRLTSELIGETVDEFVSQERAMRALHTDRLAPLSEVSSGISSSPDAVERADS